jgi:type VI secretion system protein ImpB
MAARSASRAPHLCRRVEDFEPEQVARQIDPLRKLMEMRRHLSGLMDKATTNDSLSEELSKIISNTELVERIIKETSSAQATSEKPEGDK